MNIQALRTSIRARFGDRNYRITAQGEVHIYGDMPNSIAHGWYIYGTVAEAYSTLVA